MKILYQNVFVAVLAVAVLTMALHNRQPLAVVLHSVAHINYASPDDKALGFATLMIIAVSIVAITKILVEFQNRK